MPRYRLTLEYDGSAYNGYQAQAGLPSVQEAVETAVFAFSGERVRLQAAGRTDTGVHATGQVVHVDLEKDWPERTVANALNAHLIEEAVVVLDASLAPEGWHARFIRKLCPVVELGLVGATMHMVDEAVPVSDIEDLSRVYEALIERYFAAM